MSSELVSMFWLAALVVIRRLNRYNYLLRECWLWKEPIGLAFTFRKPSNTTYLDANVSFYSSISTKTCLPWQKQTKLYVRMACPWPCLCALLNVSWRFSKEIEPFANRECLALSKITKKPGLICKMFLVLLNVALQGMERITNLCISVWHLLHAGIKATDTMRSISLLNTQGLSSQICGLLTKGIL